MKIKKPHVYYEVWCDLSGRIFRIRFFPEFFKLEAGEQMKVLGEIVPAVRHAVRLNKKIG